MDSVSFDNCYQDLLIRGGTGAKRAFDEWQARPAYQDVVKFVRGMTHEYLFSIQPADVRRVMEASEHALGDVRTEEQLKHIEDFTTPFAFQHLFHWYLETQRKIPTWSEFKDWMVTGAAAERWYVPLKAFLEKNYGHEKREAWSRAARWRLGKVYLSNMRELDLLARLRASGLSIRYHVLADVLFRVDFWMEKTLVSTYFPNSFYRKGATGRKPPAEKFFSDAKPPFKIIHVPIDRQGFGNFWIAKEDSINALVGALK